MATNDTEFKRMQQVRGTQEEFNAIRPRLRHGEIAFRYPSQDYPELLMRVGTAAKDEFNDCPEITIPAANVRGLNTITGKSAYDLYVDTFKAELPNDTEYTTVEDVIHYSYTDGTGTHTGTILTLEQWLGSLEGPQGPTGATGATGATGKSAYELFVDDFKADLPADTEYTTVEGVIHYSYTEQGASEATTGTIPTLEQWLTSLTGPQGPQGSTGATGATGANGKDAYEVYVDEFKASLPADTTYSTDPETGIVHYSYIGGSTPDATTGTILTRAQWLESLVGPQGPQGSTGATGATGPNGKDAYEVYVANLKASLPNDTVYTTDQETGVESYSYTQDNETVTGSILTRAQWLESLVGPQGATGATGATGADGEDATVTILQNGVVVKTIVAATKEVYNGADGDDGAKGDQGYSAYEVFYNAEVLKGTPVAEIPTESEWLASLVGPQGAAGATGATGPQGEPFDIKLLLTPAALEATKNQTTVNGTNGSPLTAGQFALVQAADANAVENGWLLVFTGVPYDPPTPEQGEELSAVDAALEDTPFSFIVDMSIPGASGIQGPQGIQGKSAYASYSETTSDNPVMTESQWAEHITHGFEAQISALQTRCGNLEAVVLYLAMMAGVSDTVESMLGLVDPESEGE